MPAKGNVLITGASGFLGSRTAKILDERGFAVRALVRKTSHTDDLNFPGIELVYGDVTDAESMIPAFEGINYVIHAAAGNRGTEEEILRATVNGTRNILDLCASNPIKKLVYISSCSVYGVAECATGQVVDESSLLESFPERRGLYSLAKLKAEMLVTAFMALNKAPTVCLRPGTIYGPRGENYTPLVGFSIGNKVFAVIGNGEMVLPLIYIDNLVEAILVAMTDAKSSGQVYNVVDSQQVYKKQYMETFIQKLYPQSWCLYVPLHLLSAVVGIQEKLFGLLRIKPLLTGYRLASSQNPVVYNASKISKDLGWQPLITFEEAAQRIVTSQQITA